jgi:hypothetical protein
MQYAELGGFRSYPCSHAPELYCVFWRQTFDLFIESLPYPKTSAIPSYTIPYVIEKLVPESLISFSGIIYQIVREMTQIGFLVQQDQYYRVNIEED